jgi:hypothetical protein
MWHALRAELAYFRPWLLGGLGIAAGVVIIISVVFQLVGDDGPPSHVAAGLRGFFPIIAGMVVGFIAQSYRSEERRARLLLAGPLGPRQLAGVTVLLPAILFGIGVLAAGLVIGAESLVTGKLEFETLRFVSGVAGMLFAMGQMGPLAQESTAAHRQRRPRAAIAGWAAFVMAIILLAVCQPFLGSIQGNLGQVIVAVVCMVAAATLYTGRTDFTR